MSIEVLLVEDSPGDVRLTREVLLDSNADVNLHVASDGVEAIEFLQRQGPHGDAPRPDLILLDLNLPKVNGHEVLTHIKTDDSLKTIPIVVLTTSEDGSDISRSYALHANCYVTKPVHADTFKSVIRTITDFWLRQASFTRKNIDDENIAITGNQCP